MTRLFYRWAIDPPLVAGVILVSLFGVGMIYSAGVVNQPQTFLSVAWLRQLAWLFVALVAFSVLSRVPLRWWEWSAIPGYVFANALLLLTLVIGTGAGTAEGIESWIVIGPLRFQPAELAKIATVLALARYLSTHPAPRKIADLLAPGMIVALPLALVLGQPDLGTALAFVGILFATLYWAGTPLWLLGLLASPGFGLILAFDVLIWGTYFVLLGITLYALRYRLALYESVSLLLVNLAAGTIATPLWNSLGTFRQNRLLVFLNPEADPRNAGYHLIQSKIAIGNGGLTGEGFTMGTQKRFNFLPEQHTDFIFSVVAEELGFLGVIAAIAAFAFVLHRLVHLAEECSDSFAGLALFGIFGTWFVHILVNIGMTVGIVPVTGIPLPFVSYGGSFLLMSWVAVAMAVRLAHES